MAVTSASSMQSSNVIAEFTVINDQLTFTVNDKRYQQYLYLNRTPELIRLMQDLGIYDKRIGRCIKEEIIKFIETNVSFVIPAELLVYSRGPKYIWHRFAGFYNEKYNVPVENITDDGFYIVKQYAGGDMVKMEFAFPFENNRSKFTLALCCEFVGIVAKYADIIKYTPDELVAILNHFVVVGN